LEGAHLLPFIPRQLQVTAQAGTRAARPLYARPGACGTSGAGSAVRLGLSWWRRTRGGRDSPGSSFDPCLRRDRLRSG